MNAFLGKITQEKNSHKVESKGRRESEVCKGNEGKANKGKKNVKSKKTWKEKIFPN